MSENSSLIVTVNWFDEIGLNISPEEDDYWFTIFEVPELLDTLISKLKEYIRNELAEEYSNEIMNINNIHFHTYFETELTIMIHVFFNQRRFIYQFSYGTLLRYKLELTTTIMLYNN